MIQEKHLSENRIWQGIPSIAVSYRGRVFEAHYSGGTGEMVGNYVILSYSDDSINFKILRVYEPDVNKRFFDPALFKGSDGEIHLTFSECEGMIYDGVAGVFECICFSPDDDIIEFTDPVRICDGIMMNKPTITEKGVWLYPVSLWHLGPLYQGITTNEGSYVYHGVTHKSIGKADIGAYSCDEHMIVERIDHSLWMLIRTSYGIGESFSYDGGKTWSQGQKCSIESPVSRFFIRRLDSGRILLINHDDFKGRNNLYALLSEDDGLTFKYRLLIDRRDHVSYPDADFYNGKIYIIHDRERYKEGEILLSCITEQDILNGVIHDDSFLCRVVDKIR
ncbi:MAG: exo-alpha-sialidase [Clostridia bacterium]|nr:exo-alpha-sialidase [Clostridia bacterium]